MHHFPSSQLYTVSITETLNKLYATFTTQFSQNSSRITLSCFWVQAPCHASALGGSNWSYECQQQTVPEAHLTKNYMASRDGHSGVTWTSHKPWASHRTEISHTINYPHKTCKPDLLKCHITLLTYKMYAHYNEILLQLYTFLVL